MRNGSDFSGLRSNRHRASGSVLLLFLSCFVGASPHAQDFMSGLPSWTSFSGQTPLSPWSGFDSPVSRLRSPMSPNPYGGPLGRQFPRLSDPSADYRQQSFGAWQKPFAGLQSSAPQAPASDSYQPDLTGNWRGSGGESVEVQRNRARIWSGHGQPCSCVFFLVGRRLIAYSPDTDVVRKYWYQGEVNQFTLIDEAGNVMSFQRVH